MGVLLKRTAILLILLFCLLGLIPIHPTEAANSLTHYNFIIDLDYQTASLSVKEEITYINATGQDLTSLVLNVTPAYFGAFRLSACTVDEQVVTPQLNGVVLEVPLSHPLVNGASTRLQLDFQIKVPRPGNLRFGAGDGIIALGNWYPVMAVYRPVGRFGGGQAPAGWDRHPYVPTGDAFFTEVANYDVVLRSSEPVVVAHTGSTISHEATRWVFKAEAVRDFALAISNRYQTQSVTVDQTTITAFYLPEHAKGGALYLQAAAETLRWGNALFGVYPYSTLQVAEAYTNDPGWFGQEYPNVVFVSSLTTADDGGIGSYLGYLVAHETLHQWFYGLVGNDQIFDPWLDEALTTYNTYQLYRSRYPELYKGMWERFQEGYRAAVQAWGDRPVNSSIYDFTNENHYFAIVYRKGSLFLDELQRTMGDQAYFSLLHEYVQRYKMRLASPFDFLDLAQSLSRVDLSPIIQRYFTYAKYQAQPVTPSPQPTVRATPLVAPTPSPQATTVPQVTPTPTLIQSPTPTAIVQLTPTLTPSPLATPTLTPIPSPTPTVDIAPGPVAGVGVNGGSGEALSPWRWVRALPVAVLLLVALVAYWFRRQR